MAKRYALLVGSTTKFTEVNAEIPRNTVEQNLNSFASAIVNDLGEKYRFQWYPNDGEFVGPMKKINPNRSDLLKIIEDEIEEVTDEDIFLFYYFGHGFVNSEDKLCLALKGFKREATDKYTIDEIVSEITARGFKKVLIILDCCYAGHSHITFSSDKVEYYVMTATESNWSQFDDLGGAFTQSLVRILKDRFTRKYIDKTVNALTFKKWFEAAKKRTETAIDVEVSYQKPSSYGNLEDEKLVKFEFFAINSPSFDFKASKQSIYYKIYTLLSQVIGTRVMSVTEMHEDIVEKKLVPFKVDNTRGDERANYVKPQRITEYLKMCEKLKFVAQSTSEKWKVIEDGFNAVKNDGENFNYRLIPNLLEWMKGKELTHSELEQSIQDINGVLIELIVNLEVPNIHNIELLMRRKGITFSGSDDLKHSMKLLSYTEILLVRADSHTYFLR